MIKKDAYLVEGMTCAGCERAIQKIVGGIDGVSSAHANLDAASLEVEYDSTRVTVDDLKGAVARLGYKIVGALPVHGQRTGSDEAVG